MITSTPPTLAGPSPGRGPLTLAGRPNQQWDGYGFFTLSLNVVGANAKDVNTACYCQQPSNICDPCMHPEPRPVFTG